MTTKPLHGHTTLQSVMEKKRDPMGNVIEELLGCGHWIDVRKLGKFKMARRCPKCPLDTRRRLR